MQWRGSRRTSKLLEIPPTVVSPSQGEPEGGAGQLYSETPFTQTDCQSLAFSPREAPAMRASRLILVIETPVKATLVTLPRSALGGQSSPTAGAVSANEVVLATPPRTYRTTVVLPFTLVLTT